MTQPASALRSTHTVSSEPRPLRWWTRAVRQLGAMALWAAALPATAADTEPTLTLGVFAYRPKNIIAERFEPLAHHLSAHIPGYTVRVLPMGHQEMQAALKAGRLDFLLTNPSHYISLREGIPFSGALATLISQEGEVGVSSMGSVIVRRADRSDLATLDQLKGQRVAYAGRQFLGSYMAPAFEMQAAGLDLKSLKWHLVGQPVDQVIEAVLSGQADVGLARTGLLEQMVAEGRLKPGALEVINRQQWPNFPYQSSTRLYPEWPFIALPHVPSQVTRRVAAALLSMDGAHPVAQAAGIGGFTIPADYSTVEAAMRTLRMAPYDQAPELSWGDLWARYQAWMLALLGAGVALVWMAWRLLSNNRRLRAERRQLRETSTHLSFLMEANPVVIYTLALQDGHIRPNWVSTNITRLLGYTPQEVMAPNWWSSHIHPDDRADAIAQLKRLFRTGALVHDYRFADSQGRYIWTRDELRVLPAEQPGQALTAVGAWRDITEAKENEANLSLAASVFANSYDGVIVTDEHNNIVNVNPAFSRLTGYAASDVMNRNPSLLGAGARHQDPEVFAVMHQALATEGCWQGELWNRTQSGDLYACRMSIAAVRSNLGRVQHHVAVFSDISHIKAHQAELDRLAHYDPLTGVPNRRLLADRLAQATARARRSGKLLAVCYIDLDDFKPINDELGHAMGDRLLQEIARRLQHGMRADDTLARLGGDEFVLLLSELADEKELKTVLERLLEHLKQPVLLGEATAHVSASVGVTLFPDDDGDPDTLLRHADQAMYRAKQAGRNRYQLFDVHQDREVKVLREQLDRLAQALESHELLLYYQPQVDLDTGEVIGAEALIRWNHPERGLLAPGAFLWQLEGSELELRVGEWVIETALHQMAQWKAQGIGWAEHAGISVNLTGHQLLSPGFDDWLEAALARHPSVQSAELELEILESAAIADVGSAARVMTRCRQMGVRFALDDFGTGYSSLAYFRSLPVDLIKIDQSFVRDMLHDQDDHGIVQAVVYLAHAFHRPVIAEGVETMGHAAALVRLGCHQAQGYGIARPMAPEAMAAWVQHWTKDQAWTRLHAHGHAPLPAPAV